VYFSVKDLSVQEGISREEAKKLWYKYFLSSWGSVIPWLALLMLALTHAFTVHVIFKESEFLGAFTSSFFQSIFLYVLFVNAFIIPAVTSRKIRSELNKNRL
jgi:hypothetical protein